MKGEKLHYSIKLKTVVHLCADQFMKAGDKSPYSAHYRRAKAHYEALLEEARAAGGPPSPPAYSAAASAERRGTR